MAYGRRTSGSDAFASTQKRFKGVVRHESSPCGPENDSRALGYFSTYILGGVDSTKGIFF